MLRPSFDYDLEKVYLSCLLPSEMVGDPAARYLFNPTYLGSAAADQNAHDFTGLGTSLRRTPIADFRKSNQVQRVYGFEHAALGTD